MAHILLVDPNETARQALAGILGRVDHRFAAVENGQEAWDFIHTNVKVDAIFIELQLGPERGLPTIQRLKSDPLLNALPIVVYTTNADRNTVKVCLDLHVQNFLIKPYEEELIFSEVAKAEADPWRNRHFEEETSFCKMMGISRHDLHRMLEALRPPIAAVRADVELWAANQDNTLPLPDSLSALQEDAETAGFWGLVETLAAIEDAINSAAWPRLTTLLATLEFASILIRHRLEPDFPSPGFNAAPPAEVETVSTALANWASAPNEGRCPVVDWDHLKIQIEALPGCPIIDTAAAAFQMVANGHSSCINPLMDLAARDPALSTQMLIAANKARPAPDAFSCIEDARLAVGQLGEMRLAAIAHNLVTVPQSVLHVPPHFSWPKFWTFHRGVARIAQHTCKHLELFSMEAAVRTAGELHGIGKLILAYLYPTGFRAILEHSRLYRLPLRETETLFLGASSSEIGTHFADHFGLSPRFANVMRWIDDPTAATTDQRLVAVVSLARQLCLQNKVGDSGEPQDRPAIPIIETPAWQVLSDCVFPSFNVQKFEQQMHATCRQLRNEIAGRESDTIASRQFSNS